MPGVETPTRRLVECGFIAVGIVSVLAHVSLRQDPAGMSDGTLAGLGQSLVAVDDATFLLGPGFVVGVGNGLISAGATAGECARGAGAA